MSHRPLPHRPTHRAVTGLALLRLAAGAVLVVAALPSRADLGVGDGCSGTFAGCMPGLRSSAYWGVRYEVAPTLRYNLPGGLVAGSSIDADERVVESAAPLSISRDPALANVYTTGFFLSAGAQAQSDFGVNRAEARSDRGVVGTDRQGFESARISITPTAAAESRWLDRWSFSADGHFSGTIALDGSWSLAGEAPMPLSFEHVPDPYHGATWSYGFQVFDTSHLTIDPYGEEVATSVFDRVWVEGAKADVDTRLAVDFDFLSGANYVVLATLNVTAFNGDRLDLLHTARLQDIALTNGAALAAGSGHDYGVAAIAPVPEPSTWGLIVAGLAFVGGIAKRRRARADRGEPARERLA